MTINCFLSWISRNSCCVCNKSIRRVLIILTSCTYIILPPFFVSFPQTSLSPHVIRCLPLRVCLSLIVNANLLSYPPSIHPTNPIHILLLLLLLLLNMPWLFPFLYTTQSLSLFFSLVYDIRWLRLYTGWEKKRKRVVTTTTMSIRWLYVNTHSLLYQSYTHVSSSP